MESIFERSRVFRTAHSRKIDRNRKRALSIPTEGYRRDSTSNRADREIDAILCLLRRRERERVDDGFRPFESMRISLCCFWLFTVKRLIDRVKSSRIIPVDSSGITAVSGIFLRGGGGRIFCIFEKVSKRVSSAFFRHVYAPGKVIIHRLPLLPCNSSTMESSFT